ncbi:hypothetical protein JKG68_08705 [Microvirga aerilata]|uniref:Uncharacterized protein n=1 Tax=Microvirga aerilata TaxID=670292 RepID=A0A937CYZ3_9HYPH|nr:hypothetical protein [Microvirga aerilata]MBL0404041.1 hypothetical protein [Microvirga aerilata]
MSLEAVIREMQPSAADSMVESLIEAVRSDLADVPGLLATLTTLDPAELLRLARRLGWTVQTFIDFDLHQQRSRLRIEAALASAAVWDDTGSFWEAMRLQLGGCRPVLTAFEIVVRSRAADIHVPEGTPIWEREHLQDLQEADSEADWERLAERAHAFPKLPRPDLCVAQATRALALLDWPRLVHLADETKSWLLGHMLLSPLPLADAFRLATASVSGHVRFAALERIVRREKRRLSPEEETALKNLLLILAKDENDWPRWLAVCNRYPVRNPHMQAALGRALARSGMRALRDYVESISLHISGGEGRECVTRCLSVFRACAGQSKRHTLWREAFKRWQTWDFGRDEEQGLNTIARSELDYGVVGWLIEGEEQEPCLNLDQAFEQELSELDIQWHASVSTAISGFFRLLSRHQVLAHARRQSTRDADWLPGPSVYVPAAASDVFNQRRYHWDGR